MSVKVRVGRQVTTEVDESGVLHPPLLPSSFVFDVDSLALYIDLTDKRLQVRDPMKLDILEVEELVTGRIVVQNNDGTTSSNIAFDEDVIRFDTPIAAELEHSEYQQDRYAVFTEDGRLQYRTAEEIRRDIGSIDTVVEYDTADVVEDVTPGQLPTVSAHVNDEELLTFSFDQGTNLEVSKTTVVKSITVPSQAG